MGINKGWLRSSRKPFHVTDTRQALKIAWKIHLFSSSSRDEISKKEILTSTIKNHTLYPIKNTKKYTHTLYANIEFNKLTTHKIRFQATKKL